VTSIEWTQRTWNPTTGCDRISPGCDNCYALTLAKRLKAMGSPKYQTDGDPRTSGPGFGVAIHRDVLDMPRRWREPRIVFVNSMSDLFHARVPLDYVQEVFSVMRETPRHTYQILTKRAARLAKVADQIDWPPNVWMGVSVEDSSQIHRIDQLRTVPAAVRFVSAEPLLGPLPNLDLTGIDWLIVGGESGPNARPTDLGWVRELIAMARNAGTAVFVKQLGSRWAQQHQADRKGGDWRYWPEDLRVREWPAVESGWRMPDSAVSVGRPSR
jgi:Bacteriophage protein gp37